MYSARGSSTGPNSWPQVAFHIEKCKSTSPTQDPHSSHICGTRQTAGMARGRREGRAKKEEILEVKR